MTKTGYYSYIERKPIIMTYATDQTLYTVEIENQRRVVEFVDGAAVWGTTHQYNIFFQGERIAFCYEEDQIQTMVDDFEGKTVQPDAIYFTGLTAG